VVDDDGHTLHRGQRTAVCRKTLGLYESAPYASDVIGVRPLTEVADGEAPLFDCSRDSLRAPSETKGGAVRSDIAPGTSCCEPAEGGDASGCC